MNGERKRGRQTVKKPSAPAVGIFYLVGKKLWIESTPLEQAGDQPEFAIHERAHISYWTELAEAGMAPDTEYEEHPRGRVAYNTNSHKYVLLADRCVLQKKCERKRPSGQSFSKRAFHADTRK